MKKIFSLLFIVFILVGCAKELPVLEKPTNVFMEDNNVVFTKVSNASHYVVSINGKQTTITETTYQLTQPGVYVIQVKAMAKGFKDSDFSSEITHYILGENPNLKYIYNLNSNSDLSIFDLTIDHPTIHLSDVDQDYVIYSNNMILVKSGYLHTLQVGKHDYILSINQIPYEIQIDIIHDTKPYLMINSNYYFNPALDINIRFDSFNSTVQGVTGDLLSNDDYTLSQDKVTMNKEFILNYFKDHPEYSMYILTIRFQEANQTHLARVWIHKS